MAGDKKKALNIDVNSIRNAMKRKEVYKKQKKVKLEIKAKERRKKLRQRVLLGDAAPPKEVPKTIESMRPADETTVDGEDEELVGEEAMDEFAEYYVDKKKPKICITTSLETKRASRTSDLIRELLYVIPNTYYYPRRGFPVKHLVDDAAEEGFTDLLIFNEDSKVVNGLTVIHLPNGPTSYFKLTNVVLNSEIPKAGDIKQIARPEVILNRFTTHLGQRVARILGSLFHQEPFFRSRRVITFHNQRDYIFFRHHRYIFECLGEAKEQEDKAREIMKKHAMAKKNKDKRAQALRDLERDAPKLLEGEAVINNSKVKASIQEIGPQFTMKLKWVQHGTFDKQFGEYEWKYNSEIGHSRRKFTL